MATDIDVMLAGLRASIAGKHSEAGERSAVAMALVRLGHTAPPDMFRLYAADRRRVHVYVWKDTPVGTIALISGPQVEGAVVTGAELNAAAEDAGIPFTYGGRFDEASAVRVADQFGRASRRALPKVSKTMAFVEDEDDEPAPVLPTAPTARRRASRAPKPTPAPVTHSGMDYAPAFPSAVPRFGRTRRELDVPEAVYVPLSPRLTLQDLPEVATYGELQVQAVEPSAWYQGKTPVFSHYDLRVAGEIEGTLSSWVADIVPDSDAPGGLDRAFWQLDKKTVTFKPSNLRNNDLLEIGSKGAGRTRHRIGVGSKKAASDQKFYYYRRVLQVPKKKGEKLILQVITSEAARGYEELAPLDVVIQAVLAGLAASRKGIEIPPDAIPLPESMEGQPIPNLGTGPTDGTPADAGLPPGMDYAPHFTPLRTARGPSRVEPESDVWGEDESGRGKGKGKAATSAASFSADEIAGYMEQIKAATRQALQGR